MSNSSPEFVVVNGVSYRRVNPATEIAKAPAVKAGVKVASQDATIFAVSTVRHIVRGGQEATSTCLLVYRDGAQLSAAERKLLKAVFPLGWGGYVSWSNGQKAFGNGLRAHFADSGMNVKGEDALVYWLGPADMLSADEAERRMTAVKAVKEEQMDEGEWCAFVSSLPEYATGAVDLPEEIRKGAVGRKTRGMQAVVETRQAATASPAKRRVL